jgi:hypothetical protein
VRALAYTVGPHVVFAPGRYAPGTREGRRLLAHELAHVAQQDTAGGLPAATNALQRAVNYIEEVTGDEARPYLEAFDRTVPVIEAQIQQVTGPEAGDLREALARLRGLRRDGRITCWRVSGGLSYASFDNASSQIRLHVNLGRSAESPTDLIHEAIHALHAARYPRLSRLYGEVLAAGGTENRQIGLLLLRWKAWTEYWAYRRMVELNNPQQRPEFRRDAHRTALEQRDVRASIARVREESGDDFRPWEWTPPAAYRAAARAGR